MPTQRSNQEMLDFVYLKIIEQGRAAMHGLVCVYLTDSGCRCAAGHLMDNPSRYLQGTVGESCVDTELIKSGVQEDQLKFVSDLQSAHDRATTFSEKQSQYFLDKFKANIVSVAADYGLRSPNGKY